MTPQDIREKTFEKAMFGGYDMAAVQNYQEEVATELANAQKEVAVLKGKMKVLVDKIEEYRASEDAMRLAILSAQKVGKQIEDDAQARADKILGGLQHETANEEAKLLNAKTSCAKFLEDVRNLCMNQLEYLDKLSGSKTAAAQPAAQPASVSAAPAEPVSAPVEQPAQPEAPAVEQPAQAAHVSAAPVEAQPVETDDTAADSAADDATQLYHFLHNS